MSVSTRVSSRYRCSLVSWSSASAELHRRLASVTACASTALAFSLRSLRAADFVLLVCECLCEELEELDEVIGAAATAASKALGSRRTNDDVLGELLLGKVLGSACGCCNSGGGGGNECVFSGNLKKVDACKLPLENFGNL